MVDATTGHEALSFVDGSSGYNQIRMPPEDEELTAFRTPKGIYRHKVMPFGLKNAGTTYQLAMQKIFGDMLHKNVECYVDDLVIKSKRREDHLKDLRMVFNRLRKYQLKMNPLKCAFGVTSVKFLGFIVKHRGIKVDQTKIKVIRDMLESRNLHELKSLQGRLAFIWRFISNLARRHYMQAFTVYLIARADPVRYVMSKPVLTGHLAKWVLLLNQYEIIYTPAKAVKGQAVADFLADHPILADWEILDDLPDEQVFCTDVSPVWMMCFDGSARKDGAGAGVIFVSPERHILPYSFTLSELCSNNVVEYQALIMGLQMPVEMNISSLEVYDDSMLVVNQLLTHYEVRKDDLIPYHQMAMQLIERFDFVTLEHVPRKDNQMADALANLAATLALTKDEVVNLPVCQLWLIPLTLGASQEGVNVISVLSIDVDDWRQPLIDYLEHGKLPDDSRHRSKVWHRAPRFIYYKEILYRRSFEGLFLRCLGEEDASKAMEEAHSDNGKPFSNWLTDKLCENFGFKQRNSSMYNAPANGLAEAFNKTLCNLLKKVVGRTKKDWHERINEALWAYRTTYRTPIQATPYSLVYGVEVVLPLETQIPSLRMVIQEGLTDEENAKLRLQELEALDEKRLKAQQHLECYQARLSNAFNKKVRPKSFQVGDLVVALRRPIITTHKTGSKFTSKWDGAYVVQEVYTSGAYKIVAKDNLRVGPINEKFLKRYYA
ncbi:unnamed protein product [Prunus armeniaca]